MSFGWSAGDVAAAVHLAFKIADALRASGGSMDQRHKAEAFLQTYQHAISIVQEVCVTKSIDQAGNIVDDDPQLEGGMRSLRQLYDKLEKKLAENSHLVKTDDENPFDFIARQIQKLTWAFFSGPKVHDIRAQIIGQIQTIQPILILRQSQKGINQSASYHGETMMNFEIIKDMVRAVLVKQDANHAQLFPIVGPDAGVAAMPRPATFAEYEKARTKISPYVPRVMTDQASATLKKLRGDHKLVDTLRKWLLESDEKGKNCLWLLQPPATQLSAIMYDVGTTLKRPILAYSCRQLDENGQDIATRTLFTQLLYAFLDSLLGYLADAKDARQRIDAAGFAQLNGEFSSAPQAIILIGNLLDNVPKACVCIIDNFERLDVSGDPQVTSLLKDFMGLFRQDAGRAYAHFQGRHKLCLTTKGPTSLLADITRVGDLEQLKTGDHISDKGRYLVWEELKTASEAST